MTPLKLFSFFFSCLLFFSLSLFAVDEQRRNEIIQSNDPATILGIEKNASKAEIKRAYKKLSLLLHPDKNPGLDSQAFIKVRWAYENFESHTNSYQDSYTKTDREPHKKQQSSSNPYSTKFSFEDQLNYKDNYVKSLDRFYQNYRESMYEIGAEDSGYLAYIVLLHKNDRLLRLFISTGTMGLFFGEQTDGMSAAILPLYLLALKFSFKSNVSLSRAKLEQMIYTSSFLNNRVFNDFEKSLYLIDMLDYFVTNTTLHEKHSLKDLKYIKIDMLEHYSTKSRYASMALLFRLYKDNALNGYSKEEIIEVFYKNPAYWLDEIRHVYTNAYSLSAGNTQDLILMLLSLETKLKEMKRFTILKKKLDHAFRVRCERVFTSF